MVEGISSWRELDKYIPFFQAFIENESRLPERERSKWPKIQRVNLIIDMIKRTTDDDEENRVKLKDFADGVATTVNIIWKDNKRKYGIFEYLFAGRIEDGGEIDDDSDDGPDDGPGVIELSSDEEDAQPGPERTELPRISPDSTSQPGCPNLWHLYSESDRSFTPSPPPEPVICLDNDANSTVQGNLSSNIFDDIGRLRIEAIVYDEGKINPNPSSAENAFSLKSNSNLIANGEVVLPKILLNLLDDLRKNDCNVTKSDCEFETQKSFKSCFSRNETNEQSEMESQRFSDVAPNNTNTLDPLLAEKSCSDAILESKCKNCGLEKYNLPKCDLKNADMHSSSLSTEVLTIVKELLQPKKCVCPDDKNLFHSEAISNTDKWPKEKNSKKLGADKKSALEEIRKRLAQNKLSINNKNENNYDIPDLSNAENRSNASKDLNANIVTPDTKSVSKVRNSSENLLPTFAEENKNEVRIRQNIWPKTPNFPSFSSTANTLESLIVIKDSKDQRKHDKIPAIQAITNENATIFPSPVTASENASLREKSDDDSLQGLMKSVGTPVVRNKSTTNNVREVNSTVSHDSINIFQFESERNCASRSSKDRTVPGFSRKIVRSEISEKFFTNEKKTASSEIFHCDTERNRNVKNTTLNFHNLKIVASNDIVSDSSLARESTRIENIIHGSFFEKTAFHAFGDSNFSDLQNITKPTLDKPSDHFTLNVSVPKNYGASTHNVCTSKGGGHSLSSVPTQKNTSTKDVPPPINTPKNISDEENQKLKRKLDWNASAQPNNSVGTAPKESRTIKDIRLSSEERLSNAEDRRGLASDMNANVIPAANITLAAKSVSKVQNNSKNLLPTFHEGDKNEERIQPKTTKLLSFSSTNSADNSPHKTSSTAKTLESQITRKYSKDQRKRDKIPAIQAGIENSTKFPPPVTRPNKSSTMNDDRKEVIRGPSSEEHPKSVPMKNSREDKRRRDKEGPQPVNKKRISRVNPENQESINLPRKPLKGTSKPSTPHTSSVSHASSNTHLDKKQCVSSTTSKNAPVIETPSKYVNEVKMKLAQEVNVISPLNPAAPKSVPATKQLKSGNMKPFVLEDIKSTTGSDPIHFETTMKRNRIAAEVKKPERKKSLCGLYEGERAPPSNDEELLKILQDEDDSVSPTQPSTDVLSSDTQGKDPQYARSNISNSINKPAHAHAPGRDASNNRQIKNSASNTRSVNIHSSNNGTDRFTNYENHRAASRCNNEMSLVGATPLKGQTRDHFSRRRNSNFKYPKNTREENHVDNDMPPPLLDRKGDVVSFSPKMCEKSISDNIPITPVPGNCEGNGEKKNYIPCDAPRNDFVVDLVNEEDKILASRRAERRNIKQKRIMRRWILNERKRMLECEKRRAAKTSESDRLICNQLTLRDSFGANVAINCKDISREPNDTLEKNNKPKNCEKTKLWALIRESKLDISYNSERACRKKSITYNETMLSKNNSNIPPKNGDSVHSKKNNILKNISSQSTVKKGSQNKNYECSESDICEYEVANHKGGLRMKLTKKKNMTQDKSKLGKLKKSIEAVDSNLKKPAPRNVKEKLKILKNKLIMRAYDCANVARIRIIKCDRQIGPRFVSPSTSNCEGVMAQSIPSNIRDVIEYLKDYNSFKDATRSSVNICSMEITSFSKGGISKIFYECFCDKTSTNVKKFASHVANKHVNVSWNGFCPICEKDCNEVGSANMIMALVHVSMEHLTNKNVELEIQPNSSNNQRADPVAARQSSSSNMEPRGNDTLATKTGAESCNVSSQSSSLQSNHASLISSNNSNRTQKSNPSTSLTPQIENKSSGTQRDSENCNISLPVRNSLGEERESNHSDFVSDFPTPSLYDMDFSDDEEGPKKTDVNWKGSNSNYLLLERDNEESSRISNETIDEQNNSNKRRIINSNEEIIPKINSSESYNQPKNLLRVRQLPGDKLSADLKSSSIKNVKIASEVLGKLLASDKTTIINKDEVLKYCKVENIRLPSPRAFLASHKLPEFGKITLSDVNPKPTKDGAKEKCISIDDQTSKTAFSIDQKSKKASLPASALPASALPACTLPASSLPASSLPATNTSLQHLYKCAAKDCTFSTSEKMSFVAHFKIHLAPWPRASGKRKDYLKCFYCAKALDPASPEMLAEHIEQTHAHCRYQCSLYPYRAVVPYYVDQQFAGENPRMVKEDKITSQQIIATDESTTRTIQEDLLAAERMDSGIFRGSATSEVAWPQKKQCFVEPSGKSGNFCQNEEPDLMNSREKVAQNSGKIKERRKSTGQSITTDVLDSWTCKCAKSFATLHGFKIHYSAMHLLKTFVCGFDGCGHTCAIKKIAEIHNDVEHHGKGTIKKKVVKNTFEVYADWLDEKSRCALFGLQGPPSHSASYSIAPVSRKNTRLMCRFCDENIHDPSVESESLTLLLHYHVKHKTEQIDRVDFVCGACSQVFPSFTYSSYIKMHNHVMSQHCGEVAETLITVNRNGVFLPLTSEEYEALREVSLVRDVSQSISRPKKILPRLQRTLTTW